MKHSHAVIFLNQHTPVNIPSVRLPRWVGSLPMQSVLNSSKGFMPSGWEDNLHLVNVILTLLQLQEELQKISTIPFLIFLWATCSRHHLIHPTVMGLQLLFVDDNSGCSRRSLRTSSILPQHPFCLFLWVTLLAIQRLCSVLRSVRDLHFTSYARYAAPEASNTKVYFWNYVNSLCAVGKKSNPLR